MRRVFVASIRGESDEDKFWTTSFLANQIDK